ncbi:MAG: ATP-binding protein [Candidatus Sabulitectum sp.]|nr:ATP-binding protein [Candidatus Sabulitectum sp.]
MNHIEQFVADSLFRPIPDLRPRILDISPVAGMASVIIGMRRTGKTFRLFQHINKLISEGVDPSTILYLNLEDDRLHPYGSGILSDLLDAFFRISPQAREGSFHLFLDEIQSISGWSRFARRITDNPSASLYVTGSSAKLLSTEVATEFRGRGFARELFPLSFEEFLLFHEIELPPEYPPGKTVFDMEDLFKKYLDQGGFPGIQSMNDYQRNQVLQDYVELVLVRDIIERYSIKNINAVRSFARMLLQNSGSLFSVNRVFYDFKSRGISVGKEMLYNLVAHFEDAFLLFPISVFNRSLRVREVNPRKIYTIDPGLSFSVSSAGVSNLGSRLENCVFLNLRKRFYFRRDASISYYITNSKHEVDFITGDPETNTVFELIQVCADLTNLKTRNREIRALSEAMEELKLSKSTVISLHDEETIETYSGKIDIIPAWKWLLRNEDAPAGAQAFGY